MTSEVMSTVVEAGLEATNPEHWIDGTRQGAKQAKAPSLGHPVAGAERAFTGAITRSSPPASAAAFKRGGKGGKADDLEAPTRRQEAPGQHPGEHQGRLRRPGGEVHRRRRSSG